MHKCVVVSSINFINALNNSYNAGDNFIINNSNRYFLSGLYWSCDVAIHQTLSDPRLLLSLSLSHFCGGGNIDLPPPQPSTHFSLFHSFPLSLQVLTGFLYILCLYVHTIEYLTCLIFLIPLIDHIIVCPFSPHSLKSDLFLESAWFASPTHSFE